MTNAAQLKSRLESLEGEEEDLRRAIQSYDSKIDSLNETARSLRKKEQEENAAKALQIAVKRRQEKNEELKSELRKYEAFEFLVGALPQFEINLASLEEVCRRVRKDGVVSCLWGKRRAQVRRYKERILRLTLTEDHPVDLNTTRFLPKYVQYARSVNPSYCSSGYVPCSTEEEGIVMGVPSLGLEVTVSKSDKTDDYGYEVMPQKHNGWKIFVDRLVVEGLRELFLDEKVVEIGRQAAARLKKGFDEKLPYHVFFRQLLQREGFYRGNTLSCEYQDELIERLSKLLPGKIS